MRAAAPLRDILQQGLGQKRKLSIDASEVKKMSTACVQVLTAFIFETQKSGLDFVISKSSSAFDDAFVSLGLADVLATVKAQVPA
jgi:anti-anti-sigma regulatory factor